MAGKGKKIASGRGNTRATSGALDEDLLLELRRRDSLLGRYAEELWRQGWDQHGTGHKPGLRTLKFKEFS
jgi:hypothetical protein